MKLGELAGETGEAARNVRFLISQGVVPAPGGTRAEPVYGEDHLAAIRRYQRLKAAGYKLAAIKLMLDQTIPARVEIAPGLELLIDTAVAGATLDAVAVGHRVTEILNRFMLEDDHARHSSKDD